jgi:hypothetical protein
MMMRRTITRGTGFFAAVLALALVPSAPALAGWKIATHGVATAVAASTLRVTPGEDWNRSSRRPIRKSEVWSLDGQTLNELYFVSGLAAGETLFKDADRKNNPLPKMSAAMQLTEVPEFFESSKRVSLGTSVFRITGTEPTQFAGSPGVKFTFEFAVNGSTLMHRGVAAGTVANNKLYLISYIAPSIYYFDRDRQKAELIIDSAHF